MIKNNQVSFRFKKGFSVGDIEAELDLFLESAFIDRGDLAILGNTGSPKSIVVGRTGSGKTALLLQLEKFREHVIRIRPQALPGWETAEPRIAARTIRTQ